MEGEEKRCYQITSLEKVSVIFTQPDWILSSLFYSFVFFTSPHLSLSLHIFNIHTLQGGQVATNYGSKDCQNEVNDGDEWSMEVCEVTGTRQHFINLLVRILYASDIVRSALQCSRKHI